MARSTAFRPLHIEHSATLTLPFALAEAMTRFTPEGERTWVKGWHPQYLHRAEGDGVDTAFVTTLGDEETLWMVLDLDLEQGSIGYARVTPGSRMGTVMIDGEAIDETSCWITVTYELTALTPAGNAALRAFTAEVFERMIQRWERDILVEAGLQRSPST